MSVETDADRLSVVLAAARLGTWTWDAATDVVSFSGRAAEIFAIPPAPKPTWTALRGLLHADDRERAREAVERAIADHTDYTSDYRLINGPSERWVSAIGRPRYDQDDRIVGMLGVVQDVTEQVRTREMLITQRARLQEQAELLETINRMGQLLIGELNLQKLVQALTDTATEASGAQFGAFFYNVIDEGGGSYMLYTLSGVDREHFAKFPMPRATGLFGPTFRGEGVIRLDDVRADPRFGQNPPYQDMPPGHLPVCSYLAVPVTGRAGEVIGGLFFGHSERARFDARAERLVVGLAGQAAIALDNARLFEAAHRARQSAEEANRVKDEFLATLSHELRTPLHAVLGWARLLRTAKLDDARMTRGIETIERNARAQQEIIEDLLDVSRIVSGKLRLEVTRVAFAQIIEAAVDTLRPTALAKEIRVQLSLASHDSLVLGDAQRLQQIVWNLLSNALKFSTRGARVQVALERVNSHLQLTVADTGRGIAPTFLPFVFERFRQGDSGTTRTSGGLGLGLAIVRHLVEMHGGTVAAESAGEGLGATFTVALPLAVLSDPAELAPPALMGDAMPSTEPSTTQPSLAGIRVLILDDEPDAREIVLEALVERAAQVRTAASAAEGWAILREWPADVILSDIGMPEHDGYAFIRGVRAEGIRTPAVALTAYARSVDRLRALSAGFQAHLPKPADHAELVALVASLAGLTPQRN